MESGVGILFKHIVWALTHCMRRCVDKSVFPPHKGFMESDLLKLLSQEMSTPHSTHSPHHIHSHPLHVQKLKETQEDKSTTTTSPQHTDLCKYHFTIHKQFPSTSINILHSKNTTHKKFENILHCTKFSTTWYTTFTVGTVWSVRTSGGPNGAIGGGRRGVCGCLQGTVVRVVEVKLVTDVAEEAGCWELSHTLIITESASQRDDRER